MSAIVILLVPLVAALLVCIPLGKRWVPGVTVVSCLADLILIARLARRVVGRPPDQLLDPAWSKWIAVDGLSALILLLVALVATAAAVYSVGYMAHEYPAAKKLRLYHANFNLFIFSMLAIPVLAEPTLVCIGTRPTFVPRPIKISKNAACRRIGGIRGAAVTSPAQV